MTSTNHGVIKSAAWAAVGSWGSRVSTLLVFLVLTRLLNPEDIGLVNYMLGWITLLGVFADLGLAEYIVYNHHATRKIELTIWWFQVLLSFCISISLVGAAKFGLIGDSHSVWAFVMLSMTLPLSAAGRIPEALIRRKMDYQSLTIRSLVAISISSMIAILLAIKGYGLWSLVIKQFIEVMIDVFFCFKLSQWKPECYFSFIDLRHVLKGGWGIVTSRVLDIIAQRADTIIIGGVLGMRDLGFYSIGQKIFQVLNEGLTQPVTGVIATAFGRVNHDLGRLKQLFLLSVQFAAMVTAPIFMVAIAVCSDWIPLVFGQQWQASANVTQMLCVAGLMSGYTHLSGYAFLAQNQNKAFFKIMLTHTFFSLTLLALLSRYGILAVSAVLPLKIAISSLFGIFWVKQFLFFTWREYMLALKDAAVLVLIVALAWFLAHQLISFGMLDHPSKQTIAIVNTALVGLALLAAVRCVYWHKIKTLHIALKDAS